MLQDKAQESQTDSDSESSFSEDAPSEQPEAPETASTGALLSGQSSYANLTMPPSTPADLSGTNTPRSAAPAVWPSDQVSYLLARGVPLMSSSNNRTHDVICSFHQLNRPAVWACNSPDSQLTRSALHVPPENPKVKVALQDDAEEPGQAERLGAEEAGADEASLDEVDQDLDSDYSSEQEAVPDAGVCRYAPPLQLTGGPQQCMRQRYLQSPSHGTPRPSVKSIQ